MKHYVNIYDFDGTIYDGDSSIDFYFFCLKKNIKLLLCLPFQFIAFILFKIGLIEKKEFKEKFFCFLKYINNLNQMVDCFWNQNIKKIKSFYLQKNHDQDIIISASPDFLIKNIGKRLKVKDVIATKINCDGSMDGKNCYGEEKVKRFIEKYNNLTIMNVYTDSLADLPLLEIAQNKYLIKKNKIIICDDINKLKLKKGLKYKFLKDIYFCISVVFMSLMFCGSYELKYIKYLIVLAFLVGVILKFYILKKIATDGRNKKRLIIALLFSMYELGLLSRYVSSGPIYITNFLAKFNIYVSVNFVAFITCILALYSMVEFVYYLSNPIVRFCKNEYLKLEKSDKRFLIILGICAFGISSFLYYKTNVFYKPIYNQETVINYDVIYTTDTGSLNKLNVYMNVGAVENDIRQPLFGLFSLPFAIIAEFISSFLRLIPNSYYVVFSTIQVLLLGIAILFISRMLNLEKYEKKLFIIMMMSTFSFILFSFVYEQYIISFFYLITAIYIGYYKKSEVNYCYIGAVGTLLTSGIIFPLISRFYSFKKWFLNILKCFMVFLTSMILTGQILMIFTLDEKLKGLMNFSGEKLPFVDKLLQFLYFVKSMFIAPRANIIWDTYFYAYRLIDIDFVSRFGILILIICFIGFILNWKNKFAKISFCWILFSFIILCLIGWGTQENGLILYSLYFFWSYVSLICLFINRIIKNKFIKIFVYLVIIFIMLYFNINEIINIYNFGIKYFST